MQQCTLDTLISPPPFHPFPTPLFYLGDEVVVVGQMRTAVDTAVASVAVVQVGLESFRFGQPHHRGGGSPKGEKLQESCEEPDGPCRDGCVGAPRAL